MDVVSLFLVVKKSFLPHSSHLALNSIAEFCWNTIKSKKKDTRKQIFFVFQHHLLRLFILFVQSFSLYNVISINLHEKNEEEAVVMHTTVIHNCLFCSEIKKTYKYFIIIY